MHRKFMMTLVCGCALAGCVEEGSPPYDDPNALRIGAPLPYNGPFNLISTNVERTLRMAAEDVNAAGGVDGRDVAIVLQDTGSFPPSAIETVERLVAEFEVEAIVGLQSGEVVQAMQSIAASEQVPIVTGSSVLGPTNADTHRGFIARTVPDELALSTALADRIRADGVNTVHLIHMADPNGMYYATTFTAQFEARGGTVVGTHQVLAGSSEEIGAIAAGINAPPSEALVVLTYLIQGLSVVPALVPATSPTTRWYFGPAIQPAFFNPDLAALFNGAVGVSAALSTPDQLGEYVEKFGARWGGDTPQGESFTYYDAFIITALALESAAVSGGGISGSAIRDAIPQVAGTPDGIPVQWNSLEDAFNAVRSGQTINYSGVSGPVDINAQGVIPFAPALYWEIQDGNVVTLGPPAFPMPL